MNSKEHNCEPQSQGFEKESQQSVINSKVLCNREITTELNRSTIPVNYVNQPL